MVLACFNLNICNLQTNPIQMQLQFREDNICLTRKEQVWPKINLYNTDYTVGAA